MANKKIDTNVIVNRAIYNIKTRNKNLAAYNIRKTNTYIMAFAYATTASKKSGYKN